MTIIIIFLILSFICSLFILIAGICHYIRYRQYTKELQNRYQKNSFLKSDWPMGLPLIFFFFLFSFFPKSVFALEGNTFISSTSSCSQATYGASANDLMVGFYSDTLNDNTRGYQCFKAGSSNYIGVNNSWTEISSYSVSSGDVIKCNYESGSVNFYVNDVLVGSKTDSSLSSGSYIFAYGQDYSNVSSCSEPIPTATPTATPTTVPTATPTSYYDFNTMPIPTENPTLKAIPTDPEKPYLHELCTTNFRPYESPCTVGQSMFLNPENISSIDQNIYSRVQGGQFNKCQNWRALYSENPLPYNIRISSIQNSVFIKTADGGGSFSSDDFFGSNDGVLRSINYSSSDFYYLYWFRSNYEALNLYPEPTNSEIDYFNDDTSNYLNAIQLVNNSTSESRFLGLQQCIYYWDNNATNAITNFPDITTGSGSPLDPNKDIKNNPYAAVGVCHTNGSMFDLSYWFCRFGQWAESFVKFIFVPDQNVIFQTLSGTAEMTARERAPFAYVYPIFNHDWTPDEDQTAASLGVIELNVNGQDVQFLNQEKWTNLKDQIAPYRPFMTVAILSWFIFYMLRLVLH